MAEFDELDDDTIDYELEWKLRAIAVPAAFLIALAFHAFPTTHQLQRTFLTMIPHECGHAITAWLAGYTAFPSLWKTAVFGRRVLVTVAVVAGGGALAYFGWKRGRNSWLVIGCAIFGLLLLLRPMAPAEALNAITFGGDGGGMVLGTLLVLAFFARPGSAVRRGGLRWGLLAIGAATVVDTFGTWWTARGDQRAIPFGEIEGVGLSDPSSLQAAGWPIETIVHRYVMLGGACIVAIAIATAWSVYVARREANDRPRIAT